MTDYVWVVPAFVWFALAALFLIAMMTVYAERHPMGIISKLVKKLEDHTPEVIETQEELGRQPNGTIIEDARGIMLERFEGRWVNMHGRPQNRITLPAHVRS